MISLREIEAQCIKLDEEISFPIGIEWNRNKRSGCVVIPSSGDNPGCAISLMMGRRDLLLYLIGATDFASRMNKHFRAVMDSDTIAPIW